MYLSPIDLSSRTLHPSTFFSIPTEFIVMEIDIIPHCNVITVLQRFTFQLLYFTSQFSLALDDHVKPRLRLLRIFHLRSHASKVHFLPMPFTTIALFPLSSMSRIIPAILRHFTFQLFFMSQLNRLL